MRVSKDVVFNLLYFIICQTEQPCFGIHFTDKKQAEFVSQLKHYEIVQPRRIHLQSGMPIADRRKREVPPSNGRLIFYRIPIEDRTFLFKFHRKNTFISPNIVIEKISEFEDESGLHKWKSKFKPLNKGRMDCFYHGGIAGQEKQTAASISLCNTGLLGFIDVRGRTFMISPLKGVDAKNSSDELPHLLYSTSALNNSSNNRNYKTKDSFDLEISKRIQNMPDLSFRRGLKRIRKRSTSLERNVEVMVTADTSMVQYYADEDLETYILTVMSMVSSMYRDASLGNAVNIYVVRIILLETPQNLEGLNITSNAESTLKSFCRWQEKLNPENDTHPQHHDVAILLTRTNICSSSDDNCATLGLAEMAGMCQKLRSCNLNQDTGLQVAYTIAHELGHNFGMHHDTELNGCKDNGDSNEYVMYPHLVNTFSSLTWSQCSRSEVTNFFDSGWGVCLEDEPSAASKMELPSLPPGAIYNADHQCRLSFGQEASQCDLTGTSICEALWCQKNNTCMTNLHPAAEGTICDLHRWCFEGQCIPVDERPPPMDGFWGAWSEWSSCSRSCGGGVQTSLRRCDSPPPSHGGNYCIGQRKRHKICNTLDCPLQSEVSFRGLQCSKFDDVPYKGNLYTWKPVIIDQYPCELHCKPEHEFFSARLKSSVVDGTPCNPRKRDICIDAKCRFLSCDWKIDGDALEDRCGICHGDGTQCAFVNNSLSSVTGSGYISIATLPTRARNVQIKKLSNSFNYLALKSDSKFYLNGNRVIQWSGEYIAGGNFIFYSRTNESEEIFIPGPLSENITLMLLLQSPSNGVSWEYTIPQKNVTYVPSFDWEYSEWLQCSRTCGGGRQLSIPHCVEKEAGQVQDSYCSNVTKPADLLRECNEFDCPASWYIGEWQPCSLSCGEKGDGTRKRTVMCVGSLGHSGKIALLDSHCDKEAKPTEEDICEDLQPCPQNSSWLVGPWEQESCHDDPCEFAKREVYCSTDIECTPESRPLSLKQCSDVTCGHWNYSEWSECSSSCGKGIRTRKVFCNGGIMCSRRGEPNDLEECFSSCLTTFPPDTLETVGVPIEMNESTTLTDSNILSTLITTTQLPGMPLTTENSTFILENQLEAYFPLENSSITELNNTIKFENVSFKSLLNEYNLILDYYEESQEIDNNSDTFKLDINEELPTTDTTIDTTIIPFVYTTKKEMHLTLSPLNITSPTQEYTTADSLITTSEAVSVNNSGLVLTENNISVSRNSEDSNFRSSDMIMMSNKNTSHHHNISTINNNMTTTQTFNIEWESTTLSDMNETIVFSDESVIDYVEEENFTISSDTTTRNEEYLDPSEIYAAVNSSQNKTSNTIFDKNITEDINIVFINHTKEINNFSLEGELYELEIDEKEDNNTAYDQEKSLENSSVYWHVGDWAECSAHCGGKQSRPVECRNETKDVVEDENCAESFRPFDERDCNLHNCLEWEAGNWSECPVKCGKGNMFRNVTCPQIDKCHVTQKPTNTTECEGPPCGSWIVGPWSMCTQTCGKGYKIRFTKCVDSSNAPSDHCLGKQPTHKWPCSIDPCPTTSTPHPVTDATVCQDKLKPYLCLKLMKLCGTSLMERKCCATCHQNTK